MEKQTLIRVFSGPESVALLLKVRLEQVGVESIIKNDSWDAYFGTSPMVVDLYISDSDQSKAEPVIMEVTG